MSRGWTTRFTGEFFDQVVVTASSDLGATWTPLSVVRVPGNPGSYSPALAVSRGRLGLTFQTYSMGRRAAEPNSRYWFATSTNGRQFGSPSAITRTFGLGNAPTVTGRGAFLGNYQALAPTTSGFRAAFAMTTCREGCRGNATDIFSVALPR